MDLMGSHRQTFGRLVVHTPHGTARLRAALDLLDLRLPRALLAALGRSPTPTSRPPRSDGRTGDTVHTDRGDLTAPVVVDALGWRRVLGTRLPAARRPAVARARGAPLGRRRGDGDLDRPPLRAGRLRLELPGRRGAAHRRRLLRPALPRQGHDRAAGRGPRARPGPLPGQLDPAPAARRHRGRHLLRRRLGRPLPAADGRGHPHGALLRHRLRARAARRGRGPPRRSPQALARYGDFSASHEWKFDCDAARPAARAARAAAPAGARAAARCSRAASSTGRSGTTWRSRRRSSPRRPPAAPCRRRAPRAPWPPSAARRGTARATRASSSSAASATTAIVSSITSPGSKAPERRQEHVGDARPRRRRPRGGARPAARSAGPELVRIATKITRRARAKSASAEVSSARRGTRPPPAAPPRRPAPGVSSRCARPRTPSWSSTTDSVELPRDRGRRDAARAQRAHRDQHRRHVDGAEQPADQVVPGQAADLADLAEALARRRT